MKKASKLLAALLAFTVLVSSVGLISSTTDTKVDAAAVTAGTLKFNLRAVNLYSGALGVDSTSELTIQYTDADIDTNPNGGYAMYVSIAQTNGTVLVEKQEVLDNGNKFLRVENRNVYFESENGGNKAANIYSNQAGAVTFKPNLTGSHNVDDLLVTVWIEGNSQSSNKATTTINNGFGTPNGLNSTNWMNYIDGSTLLTQINIPGTHDSVTQYIGTSSYNQCQDTDIATQLNNGVRYLDIRCDTRNTWENTTVDGSSLQDFGLSHSNYAAKYGSSSGRNMKFSDVYTWCKNFLEAHPSETILMVINDEYCNDKNGVGSRQALMNAIMGFVRLNPNLFYTKSNEIPTLDDVRGKIVLFRRFPGVFGDGGDSFGMDFYWYDDITNQEHPIIPVSNGNAVTTYRVQDKYRSVTNSTTSSSSKQKIAMDFLRAAESDKKANQYYINFFSSTNTTSTFLPIPAPKTAANNVNPYFVSNANLKKGEQYGYLLFDFITTQIIEMVYNTNYFTTTPQVTGSNNEKEDKKVLHYDFVDASASGVADVEQNGFDGRVINPSLVTFDSIYNTVIFDNAGRRRDAAGFIDIPQSAFRGTGNTASFQVWLKDSPKNGNTAFLSIGRDTNGMQNHYMVASSHWNGDRGPRFILSSPKGGQEVLTTEMINRDEWHLLTYVLDGDSIKIYIDDHETVSGAAKGNFSDLMGSTVDTPIRLAGSCYWDDDGFSGTMGDFTIYNYAVTPEEIAATYKALAEEYVYITQAQIATSIAVATNTTGSRIEERHQESGNSIYITVPYDYDLSKVTLSLAYDGSKVRISTDDGRSYSDYVAGQTLDLSSQSAILEVTSFNGTVKKYYDLEIGKDPTNSLLLHYNFENVTGISNDGVLQTIAEPQSLAESNHDVYGKYVFENVTPGVYKIAYYITLGNRDSRDGQIRVSPQVHDTTGQNGYARVWIDYPASEMADTASRYNTNKIVSVAVITVPEGYDKIDAGFYIDNIQSGNHTVDKVALVSPAYDFAWETEYTWSTEKATNGSPNEGQGSRLAVDNTLWSASRRMNYTHMVEDVSGNGYHGALGEGAIQNDTTVTLDGSRESVVAVDSRAIVRTGAEFTVSMFIKPSRVENTNTLISYGTGENNRLVVLAAFGGSRSPRWSIQANGGPVEDRGTENQVLVVGEWTQVTFVQDNGKLRLYMNNELASEMDISVLPSDIGNANFWIGTAYDTIFSGDPGFAGEIGDFRIYGKALTDTEVYNLYRENYVDNEVTLNADKIQLESFYSWNKDTISDLKTEWQGESASNQLAGTKSGAIYHYNNVDFGSTQADGKNHVKISFYGGTNKVAADAKVNIYINAYDPANLIGTVELNPTGTDWSPLQTAEADLSRLVTGLHDVYYELIGTTSDATPYIGNHDYMEFTNVTRTEPTITVLDYRTGEFITEHYLEGDQNEAVLAELTPVTDNDKYLIIGWYDAQHGDSPEEIDTAQGGQTVYRYWIEIDKTEQAGKTIRVESAGEGKNGLRFRAAFAIRDFYKYVYGQDAYDYNVRNEDLTFGMLLLPDDLLGGQDLTLETPGVLNVVAEKIYYQDSDRLEYTAVLNDIPEAQFDRNLVARSYLIYEFNGEKYTLYSDRTDLASYFSVAYQVYYDPDVSGTVKADLLAIFGDKLKEYAPERSITITVAAGGTAPAATVSVNGAGAQSLPTTITAKEGDVITLTGAVINDVDYKVASWANAGGESLGEGAVLEYTVSGDADIVLNVEWISSENIAIGSSVTSNSGISNTDWNGGNLVDGKYTSVSGSLGFTSDGFPGNDTFNAWVEIDLGANKTFNRIQLYPRTDVLAADGTVGAFPRNFEIQVKGDGENNYRTVATFTDYTKPSVGKPAVIEFNAENARYVRLNVTRVGIPPAGEAYYLQLAEMGVYNVG